MAATTSIIYQPYGRNQRPGQAVICRDLAEGRRRAEKALAAGSIEGAQIVRIRVDAEAGDYSDPEFLLTLGQVPDTDETM